MPPIPHYDLAFRFERALQPDGLRIVQTCTRAVNEAMADARRAGHDPETDPSVLLLGRHLGRVASGGDPEQLHPDDADLRRACMDRIARLCTIEMLIPLVRRGVGTDPDLIRLYKAAARERLRDLAHALGLEVTDYDIRQQACIAGIAPTIELAADTFSVLIDPCRIGAGSDLTWMKTRGRHQCWSSAQTRGDIGLLGDLTRFARTLRRDLHLATPAQSTLI